MRAAFKSLVCIPLALAHRAALACVTCDSQTACQVRHGIFGGHFAHTLLLTAAPVPLLLAAATLLYYHFPLPALRKDC